jgi:hypothetical protein
MSSKRAAARAAATGSVYDDSAVGTKSTKTSGTAASAPKTSSGMSRGGGGGATVVAASSKPAVGANPEVVSESPKVVSAPSQAISPMLASPQAAQLPKLEEPQKVSAQIAPIVSAPSVAPTLIAAQTPDIAPLISELAEQLRSANELAKSRTTQELYEQNRAAAEAERMAKERAVLEREKEEAKERLRISQEELERNRASAEAERNKLLVLAEAERAQLIERAKREAEEIESARAALVEKTAREAAEHLAVQSEAAAALLASKENERAMLESEAVEVFGLQAQIANETAAQLQVANETNSQLNAALVMLHENFMRVSSQLSQSEEEVRSLKSSLRDSNAAASAATAEASEYRERLVALLDERKTRDEQFESMTLQHRAEIESYNREIENLQSEHARSLASVTVAAAVKAAAASSIIAAPPDKTSKNKKIKEKKITKSIAAPTPAPVPVQVAQPKRGLFSDDEVDDDSGGLWNPSSKSQQQPPAVQEILAENKEEDEENEYEEDEEEDEEEDQGGENLSSLRRQMAALRASYREIESHAEETALQLQERTRVFAAEKLMWEKNLSSGASASSRLSLTQLAAEAKDNVEQALSAFGETNVVIPVEISSFSPEDTSIDLSSVIRSSSAFIQTLLLRLSRKCTIAEDKFASTERTLRRISEERDELLLTSSKLKEENEQQESQITLLVGDLDKACIRAQTAENSLADTQSKLEQSNAAHSTALVQLGSAQGLQLSGAERITDLTASLSDSQQALESLTQQLHSKVLEIEAERSKSASEIEAVRRDFLESRSALERVQSDLNSATERHHVETSEILEREKILQAQISEHLSTISSLRSSRETDANTIAQSQALSSSLQTRLDETSSNLQLRIDELQVRLNESKEETSKCRADQNMMREELMAELNNTKHALDIAIRDGDSVQAALAAARKDLSEAVESKNEVAAARDSALSVLATVEAARGALETTISELRVNLKTREDDLAKSRAEFDALVNDSKNVVSLRAAVDSAKSELESASEKVSAQIKAREEVEATLQRARGEIAALTASVESGRAALADANKIAGAAAHAHEGALAAANAAKSEAAAQTSKALMSLDAAKSQITSLEAKISDLQAVHGDIVNARKLLSSTNESAEKALAAAKSDADKVLAAAKEEAAKLNAAAEARMASAATAEEEARKAGIASAASKTAEADVKAIELVSAAQEALMDARHRAVEIEEETKALLAKMKTDADMALSAKADIAEHMIKMAEEEVEKLRKAAMTANSDVIHDIDVKKEEAAALIAEAQKQAAIITAEASAKIVEASRLAEEIASKNAARIEKLVSEAEERAMKLDSESSAKLEAMAAAATRAAFAAADLTISNAHRQANGMEDMAREVLADARQGAIAIILDAKHQAEEVMKKSKAEALALKDLLISSIVQSESASADEPGSLYEKAEHFAASLPDQRREQLVPSIVPNLALEEDEQIKQDLDMLQRKAIAAAEATRKKADEDAKATLARVQEEAKALRAEAISAANAANAMRNIAEGEAKSIVARALEETKKMHAEASAALLAAESRAALLAADSSASPQQKKSGLKLLSFPSSTKATFAKVHPAPINAAIVPNGKGVEPPSAPEAKLKTLQSSSSSSSSSESSNTLDDVSTTNTNPTGSETMEDPEFLINAKVEAENIIVQARAEAARVQHEADAHASSVLRKAFGEVELMIERAHERATEIVNNAESKMREKNESLASMEQDVAKEVKARLDRADADAARLIASAKSNAAEIMKIARLQADSLISGSDVSKETLLLSTKR